MTVFTHATAGWPVFPIRPNDPSCTGGRDCECKAPLTRNGFKDATTDPDVIRSWWLRWPHANVAIATGTPGPDVLDVDVATGGNGWAGFAQLRRAGLLTGARMLVRTPRGGLHVYFEGTAQLCGSLTKAGHFIDFKASGGYVLAPPSQVHGKPYELLDQRAGTGRLDWQAARRLLEPRTARAALPHNEARTDVGHLAVWVTGLAEGNRNNGLYWAACRAVEGGHDPDALVLAAVTAGLSETEASRTIDSARRAHQ